MKNILFIFVFIIGFNNYYVQAQKKSSNNEKIIPKQGKTYKVIKVKDGDTIVLLVDNQELSVRLGHIDCPEKKQPFGKKAKQFVSDACFGQMVSLSDTNKYDRYGRLISEIILSNGENLNKKLVSNGLAWHYIKYSKDMKYAKLELEARKKKLNIWSEPSPTAPWNWRKMKKQKQNNTK